MAAPGTSASSRIIPPVPGQSVPKEYIRQQLRKLGIKNVTEEELEYYAADLTELIRNNFVGKSRTAARQEVSGYGRERGAAIFKTFPGDKANRILYLTPSPSSGSLGVSAGETLKEPASLLHAGDGTSSTLTSSPASLNANNYESPLTSSPASIGTTLSRPQKRLVMKRKVLRNADGDSKVVEELQSVFVSDTDNLGEDLSDLSLTSVTSTSSSGLSPSLLPDSRNCSRRASQPLACCRSFIRPATSHPHNRGVKKCDPVARYHEFRALWELMKPPGERPRYSLRWQIREQLMRQDVPYYETFPGDKANRILYLTPSPSSGSLGVSAGETLKEPASLLHAGDGTSSTLTSSPASLNANNYESPLTSSPASISTTLSRPQKRLVMKRKVLRNADGDSKVVEELQSVFVSDTDNLGEGLSDLSLTSVTSTSSSGLSPSLLPDSRNCSRRASQPLACCKSFIRPATSHPHNRGVKKCDPVARYHEFRALWELMKPPGERPRYSLRWQIREQLMHQDVPYYETFPGDKANRILYLTPSPSSGSLGVSAGETLKEPASLLHAGDGTSSTLTSSPASLNANNYESPLTSSPASISTTLSRPQKRLVMKRKVLRNADGDSKVVEELQSVFVSDTDNLGEGLSDLSLTSVTSTSSSGLSPSLLPDSRNCSRRASQPLACCKSFIRPATSHPHNRGVKKCDPVARYHEFRALWELMKPPGERPRYSLRWQIREQLMHQDVPYYEPHRRVFKQNDFIVPTDKKRASLRWQVRHALAHQ